MQPNAGRKKITSLLFVDPHRPRYPAPFAGRDSIFFVSLQSQALYLQE